jgi:hypothetical protein
MNKKEILVPLIAFGIGLAFAFVSIAVLMSNGKSKKWIARKMKLGGLLLTLTAASCNGGGGEVTCYETAEINSMWINPTNQNGIEVKLDTGNVLNGSISTIEGNDFSFLVSDSTGKKFQKGLILIDSLTSYSSNFKIELGKDLKPGKYQLKLFAAKAERQDTIKARREFQLIIRND